MLKPTLPLACIAAVAMGVCAQSDAAPHSQKHWSFVPPRRTAPPPVRGEAWPRNPIDRFILARLEKENVAPSPAADRATLIRRVTLDLLGLPPSIDEIDAFVHDDRPAAYDRLVDRLLDSPRYGERWGRHWLDLARYADSNGYTRDFARQIWRYRGWVIHAFNRDLPFDRFTLEQLAGDLLPDATLEQRIATGFHRNTLINEEGGTDAEQFRVDAVADRVDTTGAVFLGLTLGCARCHDHKFDPISQREYYQFFAFLNQCDEPTIEAPLPPQVARGDLDQRAEIRKQIRAHEKELEAQSDEILAEQLGWEKTITPQDRARLPGPVQEALMAAPDERTPNQRKMLDERFRRTDTARQAFPLLDEIARLRESEPVIPTTMVMRRREEPRETFVHKRGNFLEPGEHVSPAVPAVLHPLPDEADASDRVLLARWIADPQNPLTPRVIVNRFWQRFFGRGLVETENDFGTQGSPPTHPQLLDWLATEWVAQRWSIKAMHRLIVTSATYRQSSHHRPDLETVDPQNRLWARQARLRLEAEIIRDSALAAAGLLTERIGGPSVFPPQPPGVFEFTQDPKPWKNVHQADRYRRGMYTHFWRSSPYPTLTVFDFPNSNVTCTRRVRSNTPLQALTLANDVTFVECAQRLALRVLSEAKPSDRERCQQAFRLCLSREPTSAESDTLLSIVKRHRQSFEADADAANELAASASADRLSSTELATWTAIARVILNLDEFVTRE